MLLKTSAVSTASNSEDGICREVKVFSPLVRTPSTLEQELQQTGRKERGRSHSNVTARSSGYCSSGKEDSSISEDREARNIDLGDFIVLELLRTQRVTQNELMELKTHFDELDGKFSSVVTINLNTKLQYFSYS